MGELKPCPEGLVRPIIGVENRTAQEAFAIMVDRIRSAWNTRPTPPERVDVEAGEDIQGGELCFTGTRIPVRAVLSFGAGGYSAEQIKKEYPTLTLAQIEAALDLAPSAPAVDTAPDPVEVREGWRPEARAFADLMEAQLRANDHKPGWKDEAPEPLMDRLIEEYGELAVLFEPGSRGAWGVWKDRVGSEAADVANFAMMIADVCGALPAPPKETET